MIRNNTADQRDAQAEVYAGLIDPLKAAVAERAVLVSAGQRMVREHDVGAVVLAGTDLNLAFDGVHDRGYRVIDALDVHVAVLADLAAGHTRLPSA